jgi:aminomethyltransferase
VHPGAKGERAVEEQLKRTPLYEIHLKYGARMVPFGGWEMPVQYTGVIEEHRAVREALGLFDVSHMGEFELRGPQALDLIQYVSVNNAARLAVGDAQYSLLCYENGTVVDDLLIYRLGEEHYWIVVNAANIDKDFDWLARYAGRFPGAELKNISAEVAQLALQGPKAEEVLQRLTRKDVGEIGFYKGAAGVVVAGIRTLLLSRTGYTGENGFELYVRPGDAVALWDALLEEGDEEEIRPCGLGARDTLRLEARLPLYGHEINETVTPYEAGLGFFVKLKKGVDFVGREALAAQKEAGPIRRLAGFEVTGRGIPRQGYPIAKDGQTVGIVTTGTFSPTTGRQIGLGFVPAALAEIGSEFDVVIRGQAVPARVVETPFVPHRYRRQPAE